MNAARVHVIAGGFPPGSTAGHDTDYARLRILELLQEEQDALTTTANDFTDVERWLPGAQALITYVAGPYLNDEQNRFVRGWLAAGGRWVGLHGTSGGRASRVGDGGRRRTMVKTGHHETLGGFFINHPPMRKFQVDVAEREHFLTKDLPEFFEVIDEPYMIELQQPSTTHVLLTAEIGKDTSPPGFGFEYDEDTALLPDGKTRVLGYTLAVGDGGVTYVALGHCHSATSDNHTLVDASVSPSGKPSTVVRGPWESDAYQQLLRNAIAWGLGHDR